MHWGKQKFSCVFYPTFSASGQWPACAADKKLLHLQPLGGLRTPTGFPYSNARQKPVFTRNLMQLIHFLPWLYYIVFFQCLDIWKHRNTMYLFLCLYYHCSPVNVTAKLANFAFWKSQQVWTPGRVLKIQFPFLPEYLCQKGALFYSSR